MLISLNILKKFVDIPEEVSPEEIANLLTMKTMEMEGWEQMGRYWEDVLVGEVKSVEKHPEADRLSICKVDIGKEPLLNIVCGGNNLREGMLVPLAPLGAMVLWHGGEAVKLERTKIRGVESEGMICAGEEIGLGELLPVKDERNILDLSEMGWSKGSSLKDHLSNDVIFELDNKSINHRPDLWGHYGIARELGAILKTTFKHYKAIYQNQDELEIKSNGEHIEIQDKALCDNYIAIKIKNIDNRQAPLWMRQVLANLGARSISAMVDISNYLMMESGQPMHVFDAGKINREKIIVRAAKDDEKFVALDEEDYFLKTSDIVIADSDGPIALAGIMGGLESGFGEKTREVILEFAHFPASLIRRSSMHLGLRSEASMRFEKSLDPQQLGLVANRAWQLIKEIFPEAEIVWIDQLKSFDEKMLEIEIPISEFSRVAGIPLEKERIEDTLLSLGFGVKDEGANFVVTVPTWRATKDVTLPIDLVEEVLRIYGYDNIEKNYPVVELSPAVKQEAYDLERSIKDFLVLEAGMNEIYNYSFLKLDTIKKLGINDLRNYIYLDKPVDKTRPVLRDDLVYNLLENVANNQRRLDKFAAFEIGRVFHKGEKDVYDVKPTSDELLAWQHKFVSAFIYNENADGLVYQIKQQVEALFKFLRKSYIIELGEGPSWMHPYQTILLKTLNQAGEPIDLGYCGLINPFVLDAFEIKGSVAYFTIDFDLLLKAAEKEIVYEELAKYPAIDLDVSLLISNEISWAEINEFLHQESDLLTEISLVDIYEKPEWQLENKHSLTLRLFYQSKEKTLEMEDLNKLHEKIKKNLVKRFKTEIR